MMLSMIVAIFWLVDGALVDDDDALVIKKFIINLGLSTPTML